MCGEGWGSAPTAKQTRGEGPLDQTGLVPQLRFPLFSLLKAAEDPLEFFGGFFVFEAPPQRFQRTMIKNAQTECRDGPRDAE